MPNETERAHALTQSHALQEAVCERLRRLGAIGYPWALTGGSTEDDGGKLTLTLRLERQYAVAQQPTPRPGGECEHD